MVTHSLAEGGSLQGWFGTGCIDDDPEFVSAPNAFRLQSASPCIDTGDNTADTDASVVNAQVFSEAQSDVASSLRLFDGDGANGAEIDMGAHEYMPVPEIIAWRSVRTHDQAGTYGGPFELAIELDGTNQISEARKHGLRLIEVDFSTPISLSDDPSVTGNPWTSCTEGTPDTYTPSEIAMSAGGATLQLFFDQGVLPTQACMNIDLAGVIENLEGRALTGDADCDFRILEGDINNDGRTNLIDAAEVKLRNGQSATLAGNAKYDNNVDGLVNLIDFANVKALNGICACPPGGLMMLAGFGMGAGATLVEHTTGESEIVLPAEGGTVVVDLVIDHPGAVVGYEGRLAVDAADVVSVDSADWTATDNVLLSLGEPGHDLASYFDLLLMDWYLVYDDGTVAFGTDAEDLDDPNVVDVFTDGLDLSALDGNVDSDWGSVYVTEATIGGLTPGITTSGVSVVATLTLNVAGVEGSYEVSFVDGYVIDNTGAATPLASATALHLTVQAE